MPASLVTDWKCIATAGHTVDGRFIKEEWLSDMAETYSPGVYTAKIWLDHMRYGGAYGSVRELKVEEGGEAVKLYAKISPSRSLLQMNEVWEEYLHFSIEPTEDFAKTGKCYLTGLGMTDSPASLGTDEMRFSAIPGREFTARYPGERVPDLREENADDEMERFGQKIARWFATMTHKEKTEETGEDPMDKEQFDAVKGTLEATQQAVAGMAETMQTFMDSFKAPGEGGGDGTEGEGGGDTPAPAGGDQLGAFKASVDAMTEKFGAVLSRMETAVPGTQFSESHQPAGEVDELC